jgi:hypothetical protein
MCFIPILIPLKPLSKFIISEQESHITGWSAKIFYRFKEFYYGRAIVRFYYNIVKFLFLFF